MSDFYFCKSNFRLAISTNGWVYLRLLDKNITILYGTPKNFNESYFNPDFINVRMASIQHISEKSVVEELRTFGNNDLLYTGAGISRKAGIPTQAELENILYLNDEEFLYKIVSNYPSKLLSNFRFFVFRMALSSPTETHYLINRIVTDKKCRLVTENIDLLHEKTGVSATHIFQNYEEIVSLCPNRVCMIGIGRPYFQSLIKKWYSNGTKIINIALEDTYIDGVSVFLLKTDLHSFFHNNVDRILK